MIELLLEYILNCKIKFDFLEECSILFAEPINCTRCDREKIAQILFEDYNFQKIFIIKPSILTLLSEGKYTGIVAELQDDISNFIQFLMVIHYLMLLLSQIRAERNFFNI